MVSLLNARNLRRGEAHFLGDAPACVPLFEQVNDLGDIFIENALTWVDGSNAAQLVKRWVAELPKSIGKREAASDGRHSAKRKAQTLRHVADGNPGYSHSKNLVRHFLGDDAVMRHPLSSWARCTQLLKGWVSVNTETMLPSAPGVDIHHKAFRQGKGPGYVVATLPVHPHPVNSRDNRVGDYGVRGVLAGGPSLSENLVISVVLMRSPPEMLRVAAGRVIAFVQRDGAPKRRWLLGEKGYSVRSMVFPSHPKDAVPSRVAAFLPLPAVVRPFDIDLRPKASRVVTGNHIVNPLHKESVTSW